MKSPTEPHPSTRTTLVVFLCLLIFALIASIWMIGHYLLALIMGGILTLLTKPMFQRLRTKGLGPKISAAIVTTGIVLLVIIPLSLFLTMAVKQGLSLGKAIDTENLPSFSEIATRLSYWTPLETMGVSTEELSTKMSEWVRSAGKTASTLALAFLAYLPDLTLQLVLACITCFFLLLDGNRMRKWMQDKVLLDQDVRKRLVDSFKNMAVATIWATLAAGGAQGALMLIAFLILNVPGAFLAGGAVFILAWIPLVGSAPAWIIGIIYLVVKGSIGKAVLMGIFGILTSIVDNFVRPLVLRGRSDMHPLVSLVAIFGGIRIFGILGVFLGPILAAVVISLLEAWPQVAHRFGLVRNQVN